MIGTLFTRRSRTARRATCSGVKLRRTIIITPLHICPMIPTSVTVVAGGRVKNRIVEFRLKATDYRAGRLRGKQFGCAAATGLSCSNEVEVWNYRRLHDLLIRCIAAQEVSQSWPVFGIEKFGKSAAAEVTIDALGF